MSRSACMLLSAALFVMLAQVVFADDPVHFSVHPETFVGKVGDCGPAYPAGAQIVTASWIKGMGLPDNGGTNFSSDPSHPEAIPNQNDDRNGLLLSKNGSQANCSAAGARIDGLGNKLVLTELGFDYRNGTHCSGGAPRFNVVASDGFHFVGGCANATPSPAPQDPSAWTRVRIDPANPAQAFPPIAPGATVQSIEIIFDEGTDSGAGAGLAVIDNIDINGVLVGKQ